ncbi:hypothetical protein FALBO_11590 [Fusarium albosuccineum]|uniref:Uncharacterized protein n=1 Tax=Fusarium albosuccineum TaxID=1237068 RepID=A0A8H4L5L9_9HYPO|nr:hypothetical protein FALBO_11590 [Fusarium albosuccineum]
MTHLRKFNRKSGERSLPYPYDDTLAASRKRKRAPPLVPLINPNYDTHYVSDAESEMRDVIICAHTEDLGDDETHDDRTESPLIKSPLGRRAISLDQVCPGGNAAARPGIIQYPPNHGDWFVLRCDEHDLNFQHQGTAAAHLRRSNHSGTWRVTTAMLIENFGIKVTGYDATLVDEDEPTALEPQQDMTRPRVLKKRPRTSQAVSARAARSNSRGQRTESVSPETGTISPQTAATRGAALRTTLEPGAMDSPGREPRRQSPNKPTALSPAPTVPPDCHIQSKAAHSLESSGSKPTRQAVGPENPRKSGESTTKKSRAVPPSYLKVFMSKPMAPSSSYPGSHRSKAPQAGPAKPTTLFQAPVQSLDRPVMAGGAGSPSIVQYRPRTSLQCPHNCDCWYMAMNETAVLPNLSHRSQVQRALFNYTDAALHRFRSSSTTLAFPEAVSGNGYLSIHSSTTSLPVSSETTKLFCLRIWILDLVANHTPPKQDLDTSVKLAGARAESPRDTTRRDQSHSYIAAPLRHRALRVATHATGHYEEEVENQRDKPQAIGIYLRRRTVPLSFVRHAIF